MKDKKKIFVHKAFKFAEKKYVSDVGFDLKAISDPVVVGKKINNNIYLSIDYIEYDCGIKIDPMQKNKNIIYSMVFPRSSISSKNLVLANSVGIIDPLYRESIKLRFKYCSQPEDLVNFNETFATKINQEKIYKVGERIGQIVFFENEEIEFAYVDELLGTDRGGFGSTGN